MAHDHKAYMRTYYATNDDYREATKTRNKAWKAANPERRKAHAEARRARIHADPKIWARHACAQIRSRAKQSGIPFDLTPEDIVVVLPSDGLCPVLRTPLTFAKLAPTSASLDRADPRLGYIAGNIRVISYRANALKRDVIDSNELRLVANYIDQLQLKRNEKN